MSSIWSDRRNRAVICQAAVVAAWTTVVFSGAVGLAVQPNQNELIALFSGDDVARKATDHEFAPMAKDASFAGWKHLPWFEGHWTIRDGVIRCDGKVQAKRGQERSLWTEKEYGDLIMLADWRLTAEPKMVERNAFAPEGHFLVDVDGRRVRRKILDAGDSGIYLRGQVQSQVNIWSQPMGSGDINSYHKDLELSPDQRRTYVPKKNADKPFGQWNRFIITMVGDRVTVVLNGQIVIDQAVLTHAAPRGPIALQNHGDPVEFRNLYIKELD